MLYNKPRLFTYIIYVKLTNCYSKLLQNNRPMRKLKRVILNLKLLYEKYIDFIGFSFGNKQNVIYFVDSYEPGVLLIEKTVDFNSLLISKNGGFFKQ